MCIYYIFLSAAKSEVDYQNYINLHSEKIEYVLPKPSNMKTEHPKHSVTLENLKKTSPILINVY